MTAIANTQPAPFGAARAGRAVFAATWRAGRSPWVWKPAVVGTAGLATATVALARALTVPPHAAPARPQWPLRLTPARAGVVRVTGPAAAVEGTWGLEYEGGWGKVGPPLAANADQAERSFVLVEGEPPADGARARLNAYVWPDRETFTACTGIAGHDMVIDGDTGPLPAWVFPAGDGDRWAVLVHGRGAPRAQMLRLVPQFVRRGITTLVISYRNDSPTCSDPSGMIHFGHREWRDVEAAVTAATQHGATSFILAGMSMGGGLIATFLRRSDLAHSVIATVLDAPALNWGPILRHVARGRRIPQWLVPGVMTAAALYARIDWAALNHCAGGPRLHAPTLLIHGDRDATVPVELSDAYAAAEPDLVTYRRVPGAGHVSAWNHAPAEYDAAVSDFLQHIA